MIIVLVLSALLLTLAICSTLLPTAVSAIPATLSTCFKGSVGAGDSETSQLCSSVVDETAADREQSSVVFKFSWIIWKIQ